MSDYQIFSSCNPLVDAGQTITITVSQTLEGNRLTLSGPTGIDLKIEGPQLQLTTDDIAGVFPAAGSEESPDEFLPHIALKRRTLPWERVGPSGKRPWLALMLFKESEFRTAQQRSYSPGATLSAVRLADVSAKDPFGYAQLRNVVGLADSTPLNVLYLPNSLLPGLRPHLDDLKYMAHMRRNTVTWEDTAIVYSYRLPDAGPPNSVTELHTALLVSLEKRDDLYDPLRNFGSNNNKDAALVVLHHWTFKPSKGGDFEQVIRSIAIRPNGGVLRFGNLPKEPAQGDPVPLSGGFDAALDKDGLARTAMPHTQPGDVVWRGPLRPFPTPPRSQGFALRAAPEEFENAQPGEPLDYSHAAAFELGRLLAVANSSILQDLREIRQIIDVIEPEIAVNNLPVALQKPDWVVDPAWAEEPWSMNINGQLEGIVKGESEFLGKGTGDVGGINEQMGGWLGDVLVDLGGMQAPVTVPVTQIDIGNVTGAGLNQQFVDVKTVGMS